LFDPNAGALNAPGAEDFGSKLIALQRQCAIAEMLRKQADSTPTPQGQMVSGRYVAPSIFQHLLPILQQYQAGRATDTANQAEQGYSSQVDRATRNWQSALPQATAGRAEQPGPTNPNNPTELQAVPTVQPTRGQVLQATMSGLQIPGNANAAMAYNKGAGEDITESNKETFKDKELRATLTARHEEHIAQLTQMATQAAQNSQDRRLSIQERADAAREATQARRDIAEANLQMHRLMFGNKQELDNAREADRMQRSFTNDPRLKESAAGVEHTRKIVTMLGTGRDFDKQPLNPQEQNVLMDSFQRSINPGASVRLGTIKLMQDNMPLIDKAKVAVNNVIGSGGKLSKQAVSDMVAAMQALDIVHTKTVRAAVEGTAATAKRRGLDPEDVVPQQYRDMLDESSTPVPMRGTTSDGWSFRSK